MKDGLIAGYAFPFLIGKVITIRTFGNRTNGQIVGFPFLIGKVITGPYHVNESGVWDYVSIPYR